MLKYFTIYYCIFCFIQQIFSIELFIPQHDSNIETREKEIATIASLIKNEERYHVLDGTFYKYNYGPIPRNGSLASQILFKELQLLNSNTNQDKATIFYISNQSEINSFKDYDEMYQNLSSFVSPPITSINFNDESFGEDRLTIKGTRLRLFNKTENPHLSFGISSEQIKLICNADLKTLINSNKLYIEDLSFTSKYNDPEVPHKIAPSSIGYFCINKLKKFVVIAIHLIDSNLIYTPYDNKNDWTFARMALNAASMNVQQWDHFIQTHLMLEPIRVEMMRTMSTKHPIYVLLEHHFTQLFANSPVAFSLLLSKGSPYDTIFGWGATGTLRFLRDETSKISFKKGFKKRMTDDGLNKIPNYKYRDDGMKLIKALEKFLKSYLQEYYNEDNDILNDCEIQNWAKQSNLVLLDFPTEFKNMNDLIDTLSNIIFRVSVQHHVLNSDVAWHALAFPYSLPSLYNPVPASKGLTMENLKNFVLPKPLLPLTLATAAAFVRPFTVDISILGSYRNVDLGMKSTKAIDQYIKDLQNIEKMIDEREHNNPRPFTFMKPSNLPHYVWI